MYSFAARKRIRKSFGRISQVAQMPNLIDIQKMSYESFLQMNVNPEVRKDTGLQGALKSVFPINDLAETATLEFVKYSFDKQNMTLKNAASAVLIFLRRLKLPCALSCGMLMWTAVRVK